MADVGAVHFWIGDRSKGMDRDPVLCYEAVDANAKVHPRRTTSQSAICRGVPSPFVFPFCAYLRKDRVMKILVAFEGSTVTKAALEVAVKHARAFGSGLILVWSMVKGDEDQQEDIQTAEKTLAYWKDQLEQKGLVCETHLLIRGFEAGEDLIRFASDHNVEEIVIGVRRRSKVGKLLFGSTAQYVILNAPCPVVTVR
jgi:nucleotide-binding universal stress UspA family protein